MGPASPYNLRVALVNENSLHLIVPILVRDGPRTACRSRAFLGKQAGRLALFHYLSFWFKESHGLHSLDVPSRFSLWPGLLCLLFTLRASCSPFQGASYMSGVQTLQLSHWCELVKLQDRLMWLAGGVYPFPHHLACNGFGGF